MASGLFWFADNLKKIANYLDPAQDWQTVDTLMVFLKKFILILYYI